jgi:phenylalanyl-tRNA synthetase alpha chain
MTNKIKEYIAEATEFSTDNKEKLEAFRIKFLGTKGLLKEVFAEFKNVPNDQKKEFGQVINLLKTIAEEKVKTISAMLDDNQEAKGFYGDLTRPGNPISLGSRHPISLVKNQIIDIFSTIGFSAS